MDYTKRWLKVTGWVLTGLVALFYLNDAYNMLTRSEAATTNIADGLGFPHRLMTAVGLACLAALLLYLLPWTQRIGAVALTAYLGGAAAMNLLFEQDKAMGVFGFTFTILVGVITWAPLWIRDPWVRGLFGHPQAHVLSRRSRIAGRILTAVFAAFFLFDIVVHVIREKHAVASANDMGMDPSWLPVIGAVEAVCVLLYLTPRTSRLGVVLMSAYLGGASAVNLLQEQTPFSVVFAPLVALALWGVLALRDRWVLEALPRARAFPPTAGTGAQA